MDLGAQYLLETLLSILLGIYPEVELLGCMVILGLIFRGAAIPFSTAAAPFYVPTNSAQGFQFLHILLNTSFLMTFWHYSNILLIFSFWPHCTAYSILVPQTGIDPRAPAVGVQNPNHWTAREVPPIF